MEFGAGRWRYRLFADLCAGLAGQRDQASLHHLGTVLIDDFQWSTEMLDHPITIG